MTDGKSAPSGSADPVIDPDDLADLAGSGCSLAEIAAWYRCSVAHLRARLKEPELGAVWKRRRERGRANLRRAQYKLAERNATMALLLGRTILGQEGGKGGRLSVRTGIERDGPPGE